MPGPITSIEYAPRASMRRRALGLVLLAYVALFVAGVLALVGLAAPMGAVPLATALAAGGLLALAAGCLIADQVLGPRRASSAAAFVDVTLRPVLMRGPHAG